MEFRLIYQGRLKAAGRSAKHIHEVRCQFHPQLKELFSKYHPLSNLDWSRLDTEGKFTALVISGLHLIAELDILFLRPAPPGDLVSHGGDIDNRIKTLLDALRIPQPNELPSDALVDDPPFFCLLEDDSLVTSFAVRTDRLLDPNADEQDVHVVIHVKVKGSRATMDNLDIIS